MKPSKYDADLAILCALTPKGHKWSQTDIAEIVGCQKQFISRTELVAMKKIRENPFAKQVVQDFFK